MTEEGKKRQTNMPETPCCYNLLQNNNTNPSWIPKFWWIKSKTNGLLSPHHTPPSPQSPPRCEALLRRFLDALRFRLFRRVFEGLLRRVLAPRLEERQPRRPRSLASSWGSRIRNGWVRPSIYGKWLGNPITLVCVQLSLCNLCGWPKNNSEYDYCKS